MMPLKRKKNSNVGKILMWGLVGVLIILMIISFPSVQHMTEIVVYP